MSVLTRKVRTVTRQCLYNAGLDWSELRLIYWYILNNQHWLRCLSVYRLQRYINDTIVVVKIGNKL